jgi:hypothetical protein
MEQNVSDLEKFSDKVYRFNYGYFILKNNEWLFLPLEKEFNINALMDISDTLRNLNESR